MSYRQLLPDLEATLQDEKKILRRQRERVRKVENQIIDAQRIIIHDEGMLADHTWRYCPLTGRNATFYLEGGFCGVRDDGALTPLFELLQPDDYDTFKLACWHDSDAVLEFDDGGVKISFGSDALAFRVIDDFNLTVSMEPIEERIALFEQQLESARALIEAARAAIQKGASNA